MHPRSGKLAAAAQARAASVSPPIAVRSPVSLTAMRGVGLSSLVALALAAPLSFCHGQDSSWSGMSAKWGSLPPLVAEPIPTAVRPVRLSEPTPRVWLPLMNETRLRGLPPRATPFARPLPEPLWLVWSPPEPMPARPGLPVGQKAYATATPADAPPAPPLFSDTAVPAPSASVVETLLAGYLRRGIAYWREQPAPLDWPVIPDAESDARAVRLPQPIPEVPSAPALRLHPPRPPIPTSDRR